MSDNKSVSIVELKQNIRRKLLKKIDDRIENATIDDLERLAMIFDRLNYIEPK